MAWPRLRSTQSANASLEPGSYNPQAVSLSFSRTLWWVEWTLSPTGSSIGTLRFQLVVLFGEVVQPCWRKHTTEVGLWQLTALSHFQFALCLVFSVEAMISQLPVTATFGQPPQLPLWILPLESWAKTDSSIHCVGYNIFSQRQKVVNADREDSATLLGTFWILLPASFVRCSKKLILPSNLGACGSKSADHTPVICWDLAPCISPCPYVP